MCLRVTVPLLLTWTLYSGQVPLCLPASLSFLRCYYTSLSALPFSNPDRQTPSHPHRLVSVPPLSHRSVISIPDKPEGSHTLQSAPHITGMHTSHGHMGATCTHSSTQSRVHARECTRITRRHTSRAHGHHTRTHAHTITCACTGAHTRHIHAHIQCTHRHHAHNHLYIHTRGYTRIVCMHIHKHAHTKRTPPPRKLF